VVCYGTFEHHGENGGTIDDVMSRNRNILRKILDSPNHETAAGIKSTMLQARGNTEEFNFDMLRTQYQACMNTTTRAAADISPLTDIIVSINRTWTVSPSDLGTPVGTADLDEMHQAALSLEQMGVPIFHSLCGGDDPLLPDFTNSVRSLVRPSFDNSLP
jgi:endothelin-converting enzyme